MGWFNSLSALEKTYFIIACVASVFLIIQILFMVFGGDGDADADGDIDGGIRHRIARRGRRGARRGLAHSPFHSEIAG